MGNRELVIRAVPMVQLQGETHIPSVLFVSNGGIFVGYDAMRKARESRGILNEDFKVDLGKFAPATVNRTTFDTGAGRKSAAEITAEFLNTLLIQTRAWLDTKRLASAPAILVAEPLPSQESQAWLENYRTNIRRILRGKGFDSAKIDFLPEPFAAFQYYRYGERTPLADRRKQRVIVVDFGGGTFDVCAIETTSQGDISYSNKNQKPLASRSEPVGGFLINRFIAERLIERTMPKASVQYLRKGLDAYNRWRSGDENLDTMAERYQFFVANFHRLIYEVEAAKLALCRQVVSWNLDSESNWSVNLRWVQDPFSSQPETIVAQLNSKEFQTLFTQKIWHERLRPVLADVIKSAAVETGGAPIDYLLLSGGSSNIHWIRHLIIRDFAEIFDDSKILRLDDYQEVVSKGLAIECARRFYAPQGDFGSVTYNPLFLSLRPDGVPVGPVRFKNDTFPTLTERGLLIPVGTNLNTFVDQDLVWKFRLSKPPNQSLDYFFFRAASVQQELIESGGSFDPEKQFAHLQNIGEQKCYTPGGKTRHDSHLHIQLKVKEDGTASPMFIYAKANDMLPQVEARCMPFVLDMTPIKTGPPPQAYLGLDFGTSNTSLSYIDDQKIQWMAAAQGNESWRDLSELTSVLPHPIARTLALYIADYSAGPSSDTVLDVCEAILAISAYLAYQECRGTGGNVVRSKMFKAFTQRSIGPLWAFLKMALDQLPKAASWSLPLVQLLRPEHALDTFVDQLNLVKHKKLALDRINHLQKVRLLANVINQVFASELVFGFFENVKKSPFGKTFRGFFKVAHGNGLFVRAYEYSGTVSFAESEAFIATKGGRLLPMEPLIFWDSCADHSSDGAHCFMYDIPDRRNEAFEFKAAGYPCRCTVAASSRYAELCEELNLLKERDAPVSMYEGGFSEVEFA